MVFVSEIIIFWEIELAYRGEKQKGVWSSGDKVR